MAISLPNATAYVINTNAILSVPEPASYTVSLWFSLPVIGTPANYRTFFSNSSSIELTTDITGTYIDFGSANQDINYTANGPLIANQWYHTAMVVQANSASSHYVFGYVNGQLVITSNDTTTYSTSSGVSMGTYNGDGDGPLNGYSRNVKYWSRALSGTEIQDEFNSTVPVHKAGLLAYYPFDTSLAADLSGNGNILTSNGTVTLVDGNYSKSWLGRGMNYIR